MFLHHAEDQDEARTAAAYGDISFLSSAIQEYHHDCGSYPTQSEGLSALFLRPSSGKKWKGPYILKNVPKDPWGNRYVYLVSAGKFLIKSYGADGTPGGDGENADITSDD